MHVTRPILEHLAGLIYVVFQQTHSFNYEYKKEKGKKNRNGSLLEV